jgi:alkanesulfonate monooxygenase SsuD/methylene tetrahydromethanopterin reductase-like flavin-dependent oxidoreductase (luciferase family)
LKERFEELEETLQICLRMWSDDESAFSGKHYRLERPLNSPQAIQRPHPPIMIGGSGERKTLRLVARHADACNLWPTPQIPHKLKVLREHCEREGRDYHSILKTVVFTFDVGERGEKVDQVLGQLRWLAGMGIEAVIGNVKNVSMIDPLKIMGERVIPAAAEIEVKAAV